MSGDKNTFTNYRPVSLLPQFSKILEKIFQIRLEKFIDRNNIISESQYGFRRNCSTNLAIIDVIEEITSSLDKKKKSVGIFIDMKKAFDTIDHDIVLNKLHHYGIRGIVNEWIQSYLTNRTQYVQMKEYSSVLQSIKCGVPQGSILGPTLFLLYINDICNVSSILKCILFADDTNFLYSGDDFCELCEIIFLELEKLSIWFAIKKLSLNVEKTNFMIFANCNNNYDNLHLCIKDEQIKRVHHTKFLGVYTSMIKSPSAVQMSIYR